MQMTFSILAGVLSALTFIFYILGMVRGTTKSVKATWLIWAILDTVTVAGLWAESALNGQILVIVVGVWVIFFLSLKYGNPGWTRTDAVCMVITIVSIALWKIFSSPALGVAVCMFANVAGCVPTYQSVWIDHRNEGKLPWILGTISSLCALVAVPEWTFVQCIQPVAFLGMQLAMLHLLFIRAATPMLVEVPAEVPA